MGGYGTIEVDVLNYGTYQRSGTIFTPAHIRAHDKIGWVPGFAELGLSPSGLIAFQLRLQAARQSPDSRVGRHTRI